MRHWSGRDERSQDQRSGFNNLFTLPTEPNKTVIGCGQIQKPLPTTLAPGTIKDMMVKVGGNNILNDYYNSYLGGPSVGGFYYLNVSFNVN